MTDAAPELYATWSAGRQGHRPQGVIVSLSAGSRSPDWLKVEPRMEGRDFHARTVTVRGRASPGAPSPVHEPSGRRECRHSGNPRRTEGDVSEDRENGLGGYACREHPDHGPSEEEKWWTGTELSPRHRDFQFRRGEDLGIRGVKRGPSAFTSWSCVGLSGLPSLDAEGASHGRRSDKVPTLNPRHESTQPERALVGIGPPKGLNAGSNPAGATTPPSFVPMIPRFVKEE